MRTLALIAAYGVLALPAAAAAQTAPSPANTGAAAEPAAVQQAAARSKGKDARVCKPIELTGSRLGATSVCKTRKEWDD